CRLHACPSERAQRLSLGSLIRCIHGKLERYLRMQMSLSEGKQRADQEHREIVAACRAGDAERAAALIEAHIVGVCRTLYEHLPNRPAST
ncbi:FCD domain-containing protein, partial [Pseudomonas aeruginosa]|uniref:FCD domain-containing protein n=1 Tax=Pseudomonas aeruginosa TaxID=287 RepID=UPI00396A11FC